MRRNKLRLAVASLAVALTSCANVFVSSEAQRAKVHEGLPYYLPTHLFEITATFSHPPGRHAICELERSQLVSQKKVQCYRAAAERGKSNNTDLSNACLEAAQALGVVSKYQCEKRIDSEVQSIDVAFSSSERLVPDRSNLFYLTYEPSEISSDKFDIGLTSEGFLTTTNVVTDDKTAEALQSVASITTTAIKFSAGVPLAPHQPKSVREAAKGVDPPREPDRAPDRTPEEEERQRLRASLLGAIGQHKLYATVPELIQGYMKPIGTSGICVKAHAKPVATRNPSNVEDGGNSSQDPNHSGGNGGQDPNHSGGNGGQDPNRDGGLEGPTSEGDGVVVTVPTAFRVELSAYQRSMSVETLVVLAETDKSENENSDSPTEIAQKFCDDIEMNESNGTAHLLGRDFGYASLLGHGPNFRIPVRRALFAKVETKFEFGNGSVTKYEFDRPSTLANALSAVEGIAGDVIALPAELIQIKYNGPKLELEQQQAILAERQTLLEAQRKLFEDQKELLEDRQQFEQDRAVNEDESNSESGPPEGG